MPLEIPNRTAQELKQLAVDLRAGRVWTSAHDKATGGRLSSFMVLLFMDGEQRKEFLESDVGLIYEYLDKAGPRAVNGCPQFFSCLMLNRADTERLHKLLKALEEAEASVS